MENNNKNNTLFEYYHKAFKKLGADTSEKNTGYFKLCTRFVPTHNIYSSNDPFMSAFSYREKRK